MSRKDEKIARLLAGLQGRELSAHYLGYFECFNRQLFFEAHDVLEAIWLPDRHGPNGRFFKGLIQLAGAFVHLQKERLRPSAALFRLAIVNLGSYPPVHYQCDLKAVLALAEDWLAVLEKTEFSVNPLKARRAPVLRLEGVPVHGA